MPCRWRARTVVFAVAIAASAPAIAEPKPAPPALAFELIRADSLLSHAEPDWKLSLTESELAAPIRTYRLGPAGDAYGQRARISVELGDTTVFAIGGTLGRRDWSGPPDPVDGFRGRRASGKIYGGGIERSIGRVELSAIYQYNRVNPDRSDPRLHMDNPRSHSVRATARIRFGRKP